MQQIRINLNCAALDVDAVALVNYKIYFINYRIIDRNKIYFILYHESIAHSWKSAGRGF